MKNLFIIMILIIVSCKGNNAIQKKEIIETSTSNSKEVNNYYDNLKNNQATGDKLVCDLVDFPNICKNSDISVFFEFIEEPHNILIKYKNKEAIFSLNTFFEGHNYKPLYFNVNGLKILIVEFIYEYNSHYLIFNVGENSMFYLGKFIQEDLIDKNNNYINSELKINAIKDNKFNVVIGDETTFKNHIIDMENKIKLKMNL